MSLYQVAPCAYGAQGWATRALAVNGQRGRPKDASCPQAKARGQLYL